MNKFIESRPQELCLMCGKCCRVSTAAINHDELVALAEHGDDGALDFLKIFEPYQSVDDARAVSADTVDNILSSSEEKRACFTFYHCKYILDNNFCGNYENRPDLCKNFPSSPFAVVPTGCGYEGWLFAEREKVKRKVRELKESIVEMQAELKSDVTPSQREKIMQIIQKSQAIIDIYAPYGSADW